MANVTVQECFDAARDIHPAFNDSAMPNGVLARFLTRYQQRLLTQIAQIKKDAIVDKFDFHVPGFDFELGERLPDHILIHGADVFYENSNIDPVPLTIVGFDQRLNRYIGPTAYVDRPKIFLIGRTDDWTPFLSVTVRYFPKGGTITDLEQELELPGQALDPCATALASFMAGRLEKDAAPPINPAELLAEAEHAEARYIDEITGRKQVTVYHPSVEW